MNNNLKCSKCRCYFIQDELKSSGKPFLTCKKCRDRCKQNKCEHNRQLSFCKQCCGSALCEHDKQRSQCKQCGGGSICEHNKEKIIVSNAVVVIYVNMVK